MKYAIVRKTQDLWFSEADLFTLVFRICGLHANHLELAIFTNLPWRTIVIELAFAAAAAAMGGIRTD